MSKILLKEIIGANFDKMPAAVRMMHSIDSTRTVRGVSRVGGAKNPVAWLVRLVARLPKPVLRAPIVIDFVKHEDAEEWDRLFGKSRFHTIMRKQTKFMTESLVGFPVTFVYDVKVNEKGFSLHVTKVKFLGVPLPKFLSPGLAARATEWRGRYRFSTYVSFWFCGLVVSYTGYLDAPDIND